MTPVLLSLASAATGSLAVYVWHRWKTREMRCARELDQNAILAYRARVSVLEAKLAARHPLGHKIETWASATAFFRSVGAGVSSKREGK